MRAADRSAEAADPTEGPETRLTKTNFTGREPNEQFHHPAQAMVAGSNPLRPCFTRSGDLGIRGRGKSFADGTIRHRVVIPLIPRNCKRGSAC